MPSPRGFASRPHPPRGTAPLLHQCAGPPGPPQSPPREHSHDGQARPLSTRWPWGWSPTCLSTSSPRLLGEQEQASGCVPFAVCSVAGPGHETYLVGRSGQDPVPPRADTRPVRNSRPPRRAAPLAWGLSVVPSPSWWHVSHARPTRPLQTAESPTPVEVCPVLPAGVSPAGFSHGVSVAAGNGKPLTARPSHAGCQRVIFLNRRRAKQTPQHGAAHHRWAGPPERSPRLVTLTRCENRRGDGPRHPQPRCSDSPHTSPLRGKYLLRSTPQEGPTAGESKGPFGSVPLISEAPVTRPASHTGVSALILD